MNPRRREEELSQEEFNRILKKAGDNPDACMFPHCSQKAYLTIQKADKRYGLCAEHWSLISGSDIEI